MLCVGARWVHAQASLQVPRYSLLHFHDEWVPIVYSLLFLLEEDLT